MTSEGTLLRAPVPTDADAVTGLINACEIALHGVPEVTVGDVRRTWTAPGTDPTTDAVLAVRGGRVAGYAEFERADEPQQIEFDGYVHPEARGRGIGSALIDWAERRATQIAAAAAPGTPVVLRHGLWADERTGVALFEARGYQRVRSFFFMLIELDGPLASPVWPAGITLRTFVPGGDDRGLWEADEEGFADHWGFAPTPFAFFAHHILRAEDFDPDLVFLAVDGEEIAGSAICSAVRPEDPRKGWVRDLSVRPAWRRRGIALALLRHAFLEYARRGYERVGLSVDAENPTGALDLYRKAGMRVDREAVAMEKTLRPATP